MLILTRRPTEAIIIGDDIKIVVIEVRGNQVRMGVEAPKTVAVHREEIYERIRNGNVDGNVPPGQKQGVR